MPIVSAPAPSGTAIDGSQYNALRQDVLVNHRHDGASASQIDHANLLNIGSHSHAQIDAALGSLQTQLAGGIPWTKIQIGRPAFSDTEPLAGGARQITFAEPFTRPPIVFAHCVFDGGNNIDKLAVMTVLYGVSITGFAFAVIHPGLDGGSPGLYQWDGGAGWPYAWEGKIHWMALEPPA